MIFHRPLCWLIALGVLLYGCAPRLTWEELEARYGRQAPIIIKYGAVDRLQSGQSWRVFMAAEDPDGDMDAVVFELYQPGTGWYPAYAKKLKAERSRSFSGYFYLNTPAFWPMDMCMWGLKLTLRCEIKDKADHVSNVVMLCFEFVGKKVMQPVPEGFTKEDVRRLGPIMIDLECDGNDDRKFTLDPS